ncbi:hypothetical protein BgiBS90_029083 [Biomphalaria glabrata]|nr:hypothetical protein BgiBS90_029083 [Biomphalaria glabrata]
MNSSSRSKDSFRGFKSLSFRHKGNNKIVKSQSCRSFRKPPTETYTNIIADDSGRNVISEVYGNSSCQTLPPESHIPTRLSALDWARWKFSLFRDSLKRRNNDRFIEKDFEYKECDDNADCYDTPKDCQGIDKSESGVNEYSNTLCKEKSQSADNVNKKTTRQHTLAGRFHIVRWIASKVLKLRRHASKRPRVTRSNYEMARPIEESDSVSMTSSNADPVYMDPVLAFPDQCSPENVVEVHRESNPYFELEPEQQYETVTIDSDSKPALSLTKNAAPSQYAKLGEHNKVCDGNIYGELSPGC